MFIPVLWNFYHKDVEKILSIQKKYIFLLKISVVICWKYIKMHYNFSEDYLDGYIFCIEPLET